MALSHGRSMSFWVSTPSGGASALVTNTAEVTGLPGDVDLGDVTVPGQVGHTSYPGLQKASFSTKHFFDDTASVGNWAVLGSFQSLQQTYPTVPWGITFGPKGTTAGYPKIVCNAWIKSVNMSAKATDPNAFTVSWELTAGSTGVSVSTY